jgi:hypothetical protein
VPVYSISLVIGRSIACRGFVSTTPDIGVRPPLTLEFESTFSLSRSMLSKPRPTLMLSHLCPFRNLKDENSAAQESMLEETGQKTTPEPSQVPPQDESKEDNRQGGKDGILIMQDLTAELKSPSPAVPGGFGFD